MQEDPIKRLNQSYQRQYQVWHKQFLFPLSTFIGLILLFMPYA